MKNKFYLEIDTGGAECSGYEDRLPWVCYGTIVAEGNSLEELLEDASVDLVDQDGGEAGIVEADSEWMQRAVAAAYYEKYCGLVQGPKETDGDFLARCERGGS